MFYIGWRDLQFRRRRFIIAILATSLVFAIALILSGVSGGFHSEISRSVDSFDAGGWVVPTKAAGPFSNSEVFAPDDVVLRGRRRREGHRHGDGARPARRQGRHGVRRRARWPRPEGDRRSRRQGVG